MAEMPIEIRAELARAEMKKSIDEVAAKYRLPDFMVDLALEATLAEEYKTRLAGFCACVDEVGEKTEEE